MHILYKIEFLTSYGFNADIQSPTYYHQPIQSNTNTHLILPIYVSYNKIKQENMEKIFT